VVAALAASVGTCRPSRRRLFFDIRQPDLRTCRQGRGTNHVDKVASEVVVAALAASVGTCHSSKHRLFFDIRQPDLRTYRQGRDTNRVDKFASEEAVEK
jgi:hypothetical protein